MSELKSFIVLYDGKFIRAYEEKEADKAIAELKQQIEILQKEKKIIQDLYLGERDDCRIWAARAIHNKHKRCLAMAEACMHKRWRPDEWFDYARSTRHMKKWLELADKFKEAK